MASFSILTEEPSTEAGESPSAKQAAQKKSGQTTASKPTAPPRKILVVDDESSNLLVQRRMLDRSGFVTSTASSLREAVDLLSQTDDFSAVLMDIHMPEGNGYELFQTIREGKAGVGNRSIPLFACTADASEGARHKVESLGFDGMLVKPINLADLREMMKAVPIDKGGTPPPAANKS